MANILLGISGGIAAYKSAYLARLLMKNGHKVRVVMTFNAESFITPLTFEALTHEPVLRDNSPVSAISHIDYAKWADIVILAPATANTIAKLACGIADNMLLSTFLAAKAPIFIAPAMNSNMYENVATKENLLTLSKRGFHIINPSIGELACSDSGVGRMAEPEEIYNFILKELEKKEEKDDFSEYKEALSNLNILITAGPTKEFIDPIRYITNRSSGKMGIALYEAAKAFGANVKLILGNEALKSEDILNVISAEDMYNAVMDNYEAADIIIMSAAVADFTMKDISKEKLKKNGKSNLTLELTRTKDILKEVGAKAKNGRKVIVGFAAETENVEGYAKSKLEKKKCDVIVANDVSRSDIAMGSLDNEVTLYFKSGRSEHISKRSKEEIAKIILVESAILFHSLS